MNRFFFPCVLSLFSIQTLCFSAEADVNLQLPWFTGPIITPSAHVVPLGSLNVEPYFYADAIVGAYNKHWNKVKADHTFWNNESQIMIDFGLTSWFDFELNPTVFWNYIDGNARWEFGDMPIGVNFQLYQGGNGWMPAVKLEIHETIPCGKYRHLNPLKQGTDVGGNGTWNTKIGFVLGKTLHIRNESYFNFRANFIWGLPAPVRLKGFNSYGGGYGTNVRYFPSKTFETDLGFEVSLNRHWVLALDVVGNINSHAHYSGHSGTTPTGEKARIVKVSSTQFSLAPAIEYNWNAAVGIIGGVWFTVAGRNSGAFYNGVIAINYYLY